MAYGRIDRRGFIGMGREPGYSSGGSRTLGLKPSAWAILGCQRCNDSRRGRGEHSVRLGALRPIAVLRMQVLCNGFHLKPESRIGLGESHAVQHKSHRAHIEPFKYPGRVAELGARRHARLDHDEDAIDKTGQVLGLCGYRQRRGIGEHQAPFPVSASSAICCNKAV